MFRSKGFIAFMLLLFLLACGDEATDDNSEVCLSPNTTTGILLTDINGSSLGSLGTLFNLVYLPNELSNVDLQVFPNPSADVLSIIYPNQKLEARIIPANKLTDCENVETVLSRDFFSFSDVPTSDNMLEFSYDSATGDILNVDVSSLEEGYYNLLFNNADSELIISRYTIYINRSLTGDEVFEFLSRGW